MAVDATGEHRMAMRSMTGFGRGEASSRGIAVEVELSSVNRKQLDIRVILPRRFSTMESRIHDAIRKSVSRGSVTGSVNITFSGQASAKSVVVDTDMARAYVRALRKAASELGLKDDLTTSILSNIPDIVKYQDVKQDTEKVWRVVSRALGLAVEGLMQMRSAEGASLERDMVKRTAVLNRLLVQIEKRAPGASRRYASALKKRLKEAGTSVSLCDQRLLKEIAIFADRIDISEEITRLRSHLSQVDKLLVSRKPVGRTMDFLGQEMLREINTIGSKANDRVISANTIRFKTQLESIREQIQNVE